MNWLILKNHDAKVTKLNQLKNISTAEKARTNAESWTKLMSSLTTYERLGHLKWTYCSLCMCVKAIFPHCGESWHWRGLREYRSEYIINGQPVVPIQFHMAENSHICTPRTIIWIEDWKNGLDGSNWQRWDMWTEPSRGEVSGIKDRCIGFCERNSTVSFPGVLCKCIV